MMDDSTRKAAQLWTLAQPRISAFVTPVFLDFRDRDDLMQDTAVAVFESFDLYDPSRPFPKWALGVARNQFKNYLRKRKRDHSRLVFDDETVARVEDAFASESAEEF